MAQRVTITLEDDLGGGPADETVPFTFGGTQYEIDLSAKNATAFRKKLAPFIEHARKAGAASPASRAPPPQTGSAAVKSGHGPTPRASRSVAASPPAWQSNTTLPPHGADARWVMG